MNKFLLLPFALLAPLCPSEEPAEQEDPPKPPTPELIAAYQHDAGLACQLHRLLTASQPGENAFFSPASITAALAMVGEGVRGETLREFARVLQGSDDLDVVELRAARADLAHRLRAASKDIHWSEANGLWFDDHATLVGATQKALRTHYGASLEAADFRGRSEEIRQEINAWVEKKTGDRIKGLLPSGSLSPMTKLVIVNAVHFIGQWDEEFEAKTTTDLPFLRADGTESSVPFLRDLRKLPVAYFGADDQELPSAEEAQLTAFEVPYRGGQLSFVGLIPSDETGLPALEKRIDQALLKRWLSALRQRRADFAMPKLELEPSYDLAPVLRSLGLNRVMSPETAELDGFFQKGGDELCVTGAFHKSFLRVDEEGTEAAAATGVVAGVTSAPAPPTRVHADRPYLFFIRERSTGAVLFMGRIVNP